MRSGGLPAGPSEAEALARDIVGRLESAEPLSQVLSAIRRLAELINRPAEALWMTWEITGYSKQKGKSDPLTLQADVIWRPLHTVPDTIELADALMRTTPGVKAIEVLRGQVTQVLAAGPLVNLEKPFRSASATGGSRQPDALEELRTTLNETFVAEVIQRVKEAAHRFVSSVLLNLTATRARVAMLGLDAITVFGAAGPLLDRLSDAVDDLGWPGREASACLAARSTLEQLGLALYQGDGKPYRSPIEQREFNPLQSETHRLHAVIDRLWAATEDDDRRRDLALAHERIQRVRDIGARAKTQLIPHVDATQAVQDTYQVAHVLCFVGGFPARDDTQA